jgi:hypothetical protein
MVNLQCAELGGKRNIIMWNEGQGKTTRRRRLEDKNNEKISNIKLEGLGGDVVSGTNLAEEGWEERCVSNTGRADKEPI